MVIILFEAVSKSFQEKQINKHKEKLVILQSIEIMFTKSKETMTAADILVGI